MLDLIKVKLEDAKITYVELTGRTLDRARIELLAGVHRLSELAELADDPEWVERQVKAVAEWSHGERR